MAVSRNKVRQPFLFYAGPIEDIHSLARNIVAAEID